MTETPVEGRDVGNLLPNPYWPVKFIEDKSTAL
jgi:hypothetical protein